ncbi:MAG TPA: helicase-associated domain-containing protein, partial [Dictyobacter sp.]|nr:helicase-associated domain-containing protein [Dictyobacter sp.]
QNTIEPTKNDSIPKRITKKLTPLLMGEESAKKDAEAASYYFDFIYSLLTHQQIVQTSQPPVELLKPRLEPGDYLSTWSQLSLTRQIKVLYDVWMQSRSWADPYTDPSWESSFYTDKSGARTTLVTHFRECNVDTWYSFLSLLEQIKQESPLAAASIYAYNRKIEEKNIRKLSFEDWARRYMHAYFGALTTLNTLGLIDIGYESADTGSRTVHIHSIGYRLTDFGAQILTQDANETQTSPSPTHSLIVQPSFELLLLQPDMPALYSLLPFVQIEQIDLVSRMKLNSTSVRRGLAAGLTIEKIIETLEEHSQKPLPQNVLYSLRDWSKQQASAKVSMNILLEVANEETIKRLCAHATLQKHDIRQIMPGLLAINGDTDLSTIHKILEQEGVTIHYNGTFPRIQPKSNNSMSRYY